MYEFCDKYVHIIQTKYSDPFLNNQNCQNPDFAPTTFGTILWSECKSIVLRNPYNSLNEMNENRPRKEGCI